METHFGDILLLLRTDGTSLISDTRQNFILSGVLGMLRAGDDGQGDDIVSVSEQPTILFLKLLFSSLVLTEGEGGVCATCWR